MKFVKRIVIYCICLTKVLVCTFFEEAGADSQLNQFLLSGYQAAIERVSPQTVYSSSGIINWFDDPEARVGKDSEGEIRYALRARPKFSGERTAEDNIKDLEKQQRDLIRESILSEALKNRYDVIIDMVDHQTRIKHHTQELRFSRAGLNLLQNQVGTKAFDPGQLQEIELDIFMMEQQIRLHSDRLARILEASGLSSQNGAVNENWSAGLITPPSMIEQLALNNDTRSDLDNFPLLMHKNLDVRIAQEEYDLEKAQRYSLIRYVELGYNDKPQPQTDSTEISLAFTLPIGSGYSNIGERVNDLNRAQIEHQKSQLRIEQKLNDMTAGLNWLSRQYRHIENAILRINGRLSIPHEIKNPVLLLKLKQEKLTRQKILWGHHLQALRNYVGFLHLSGRLSEKPLKNRLLAAEPLLKGGANNDPDSITTSH